MASYFTPISHLNTWFIFTICCMIQTKTNKGVKVKWLIIVIVMATLCNFWKQSKNYSRNLILVPREKDVKERLFRSTHIHIYLLFTRNCTSLSPSLIWRFNTKSIELNLVKALAGSIISIYVALQFVEQQMWWIVIVGIMLDIQSP